MTVYVLNSPSMADKIGGPKTYEVTRSGETFRVEGVAASADPHRKVASDTEIVAEGDHVKFISTNQLRLEADDAHNGSINGSVGPSLEF